MAEKYVVSFWFGLLALGGFKKSKDSLLKVPTTKTQEIYVVSPFPCCTYINNHTKYNNSGFILQNNYSYFNCVWLNGDDNRKKNYVSMENCNVYPCKLCISHFVSP